MEEEYWAGLLTIAQNKNVTTNVPSEQNRLDHSELGRYFVLLCPLVKAQLSLGLGKGPQRDADHQAKHHGCKHDWHC